MDCYPVEPWGEGCPSPGLTKMDYCPVLECRAWVRLVRLVPKPLRVPVLREPVLREPRVPEPSPLGSLLAWWLELSQSHWGHWLPQLGLLRLLQLPSWLLV